MLKFVSLKIQTNDEMNTKMRDTYSKISAELKY